MAEKNPNIYNDESDDDDAEICVIKLVTLNIISFILNIISSFDITQIKRVSQNDKVQSDMVNSQIAAMDRCATSANIINVQDCGKLYYQTGDYYVLILDYCNGGTFEEYLQNFPGHVLSEYEAYFWFKQLMKIYWDLINCGVIHRDIKPKNLLIHYDERDSLPTLV